MELYISESGKNADYLKAYFGKREQKVLQLSIDGVQPEQGHNILYIVREVLSGKILFAHYSTHSDEAHNKYRNIIAFKISISTSRFGSRRLDSG